MHLLGVIAHQSGRHDIAVKLIHNAIALRPNWPEAHSNLGNCLKKMGRLDEAVAAYRQAIATGPGYAGIYCNLGNALKDLGQIDEAISAYRRAIALSPGYAEAHCNLGNALRDKGQLDESVAACSQAITLNPNLAEAHCNLGNALKDQGRLDSAIAAYGRAITLRPAYAEAHSNLGNALRDKGHLDDAITACRHAIALRPDYTEAYCNLGNALRDSGQAKDAIMAFRQAIDLRPGSAEAHCNLGNALKADGQIDEAIGAYRQAMILNPGLGDAFSNLGAILLDSGQLDEAIAACRRAVALDAKLGKSDGFVNLLFALYHHPDYDSKALLEETREWGRQQEAHSPSYSATRRLQPDRKLKVGYLSPFFCVYPEVNFVLPLLAHHNHSEFEVCCFSTGICRDGLTKHPRPPCDHWFDMRQLGRRDAVELLRAREIDILVNISGSASDCLKIFASRVAPVQVTWLPYASSTTGLETVDYRISDPFIDPVGMDQGCYSEITVHLPETAWCYDPLTASMQVNSLPALSNGFLTFGSLNRFSKINPLVVAAWAEIMRTVPNSRLHILAVAGTARGSLLDQFRQLGLTQERIEFIDKLSRAEYLKQYNRIDIMLDTFPYSGHTTVLDALWMGVPVVTLLGRTSVGRCGASALQNLELAELIGRTPQEYVDRAVILANDRPRLQQLRSSLRRRMEQSPLMDGLRFARNIEAAYRQMWRNWCAHGPPLA